MKKIIQAVRARRTISKERIRKIRELGSLSREERFRTITREWPTYGDCLRQAILGKFFES